VQATFLFRTTTHALPPWWTLSKDYKWVSSLKRGTSTNQTSLIFFLRSSMLILLIASDMGQDVTRNQLESTLSEVFRSVLLQTLTLIVCRVVWFHLQCYVVACSDIDLRLNSVLPMVLSVDRGLQYDACCSII
jgi:hypothetical protein